MSLYNDYYKIIKCAYSNFCMVKYGIDSFSLSLFGFFQKSQIVDICRWIPYIFHGFRDEYICFWPFKIYHIKKNQRNKIYKKIILSKKLHLNIHSSLNVRAFANSVIYSINWANILNLSHFVETQSSNITSSIDRVL